MLCATQIIYAQSAAIRHDVIACHVADECRAFRALMPLPATLLITHAIDIF